MAARRLGGGLQRHDGGDRDARADRPPGARPAQHRHRGHADPAGQRRGRDHAAPGRAGHGRAAARLAARAPRGPRRPLLVGVGARVVRHRWVAADRVGRRAGRARRRRLVDPARQPARRLARPVGAGARRLEKLEDAGIGTGPLSPFDVLVRSRRPRHGRDGHSPASTACAARSRRADWRRDGTALVTVIPTEDGNSPAGRATLDRIRAATPGDVADRRRGRPERRLRRRRLRQLPARRRAHLRPDVPAARTRLPLARAAGQGRRPEPALGRGRVGPDGARVAARPRLGGDLGHRGDAGDQRRDAGRRLRVPVRRLDGLPGVHHQPDAGGVRPHRLDGSRGRRGHRPHRAARHERRADPRPRVRRHERQPRHRGQDVRDRARRRHPARRHARPRRPRSRGRRDPRPLELVAAAPAGARALRVEPSPVPHPA